MGINRQIVIDVKNDISAAILEFFREKKINYERTIKKESNIAVIKLSPLADANDKFGDTIIALQNFSNRLIIEKKRKVRYSEELVKKINERQLSQETIKMIKTFKYKFKNGKEINSNLSRLIWDSQKLDYLFNIWNIKHLHLSESVSFCDETMANNRAKQLLFFIEDKDEIYFLDVKNHPRGSGFTVFNFLEIMERNGWLGIVGLRKMCGIKLVNPIKTDEDIYKCARNGISTAYEINGNCYMSMGITSKGNKTEYTMNLIRINRLINILASKPHIKYLSFHLELNGCLGWIHYKENGKDELYKI